MSKRIDLLPFCDPDPGGLYPGMSQPYQVIDDPWLCATDGHIVVRVPAKPESEPETAGATPICLPSLPWPLGKDTPWEPWPKKRYYTDQGCLCKQCGGNDYTLTNVCAHCDGFGDGYLQRIGKAIVQHRYDVLIRDLPDVRWSLVDFPYSTPLVAFHFTGGEGLVHQTIPMKIEKA